MLPLPFPDTPPVAPQRPRRLRDMHAVYGITPGAVCGTCRHLLAVGYDRVFFKCALSHVSNSSASDWRKGWAACGKHEVK